MSKIEIVDREKYLLKCEELIAQIKRARQREDEEFEKQWRKMPWPFKDRDASRKPDNLTLFEKLKYPSRACSRTKSQVEMLKTMLTSSGTGLVYAEDWLFYSLENGIE